MGLDRERGKTTRQVKQNLGQLLWVELCLLPPSKKMLKFLTPNNFKCDPTGQ